MNHRLGTKIKKYNVPFRISVRFKSSKPAHNALHKEHTLNKWVYHKVQVCMVRMCTCMYMYLDS